MIDINIVDADDGIDSASTVPPTQAYPAALVDDEQWLVWRVEERDNSETKVPYSASNPSKKVGTDSPDSWTDFITAYETMCTIDGIDGIGFVFTAEDPYVGIDLDHIVGDSEIDEWAQDVVSTVDSYTEVSPSGDGLHIIAEGSLLTSHQQRDNNVGLEMYDSGRFFTVTGRRLVNSAMDVKSCPDAVHSVQTKLLDKCVSDDGGDIEIDDWDASQASSTLNGIEQEMEEYLIAVNDKFEKLHQGYNLHYPSPSEADKAYLNQLAWVTKGDAKKMESIARSGDRLRSKWDSDRGNSTWLRQEIKESIRFNDGTVNKSFGCK